MTSGKRFVAYRLEPRRGQPKPAKMPYSPDAPKGASSTDPSHWVTFETATAYASKAGLDGVMRAFVESDGLVGVDLDHCRDPESGELADWAATIVRRLDTYTELSPSGTGVHLWLYGALPPSGRKRGDVEMYSSARFFTLTGQHLEGTPTTVGYRPDAIEALHRETFGVASNGVAMAADPDRSPHADYGDVDPACQSRTREILGNSEYLPALQLGDEDVISVAEASPHNGEKFRRLWDGDVSDYASGSEADAALCELLAFYGGPDRERIDRLYRRSGLYREKWDERHFADGRTYGQGTIDLALSGKTRFYGDTLRAAPKPVGSDGASTADAARVAYLERALLDRDDRIESLLAANATLSIRLTAATARLDGWKTVLSNPKLKPADRIAALPIIEQVRAARTLGQDEIHIRYPGIVKGWGLPESTLGKSVAVLTQAENAPLGKRSEHVFRPAGPTMATHVYATVDGDLYAAVGAYDPGLPQNGGRRLPRCRAHPTADVIIRSTTLCAICRTPIGQSTERTLCRQSDAIETGAPPTVSVVTLCPQSDGIGDGDESSPMEVPDAAPCRLSGSELPARDSDHVRHELDGRDPAARAVPEGRHDHVLRPGAGDGDAPQEDDADDAIARWDGDEEVADWPEDGPWLRLAPADMPPERVCELHGIPKLRSGRCSMCQKPASDAIITPAPRGQKGWRCMALLPDGRICRSLDWRIRTDGVLVCSGRGHQADNIAPVAGGTS